MKIRQHMWKHSSGWTTVNDDEPTRVNLVLYFASPLALEEATPLEELARLYPDTPLIGCSTGGEVIGIDAQDDSIVATALELERSSVVIAETRIESHDGDSTGAGWALADQLVGSDLKGVFILSDGLRVNGSELVRGLRSVLGDDIALTGGLAGDGAAFMTTKVGTDAYPAEGRIIGIGFYGDAIRIGTGSYGGWQEIGPMRTVTRSTGNVLHGLDGESALDLYKKYLGEEAANLPLSALHFPLRVYPRSAPQDGLVRTIINIDAETDGMVFAGDIPEGHVAQMMLGNFDDLIAGAAEAARLAAQDGSTLAVLVSCIGRKLLLGQRTSEEVEAVSDVLGTECRLAGFYSYGEIAPQPGMEFSDLHNQTMTITTIAEV